MIRVTPIPPPLLGKKSNSRNFSNSSSVEFDIIVCNPPYIANKHIKNLHNEVKNYEPIIALKGGPSGLESFISLLPSARNVIKNNKKVNQK